MKKYFFALIPFFLIGNINSQSIDAISAPQTFNIQKVILPPILSVKEGSLKFEDENGNNRLDANEIANISFILKNTGKGTGFGLIANISYSENVKGLSFDNEIKLKPILSNQSQFVSIPVYGKNNLSSGKVDLKIIITEPNGLDCSPILLTFNTLKFQEPNVEIVDGNFSTNDGTNIFEKKIPANLNLVIQNTGQSTANAVRIKINNLNNDVVLLAGDEFSIEKLNAGESKKIVIQFITKATFNQNNVNFNITASEAFGKYGSSREFSVAIHQKLEASNLIVKSEKYQKTEINKAFLSSDVDRDIPSNNKRYPNRYALVIGNEDYSTKQSNLSTEANVAFARNDANSFKNYLTKTLGFQEDHVTTLNDATSGEMNREIEKLVSLAKLDPKSEIVFYYAGHGLPDDNKKSYLLPVDVSTINFTSDGISLKELNLKLASSKASKITVFLDACFSGGGRDQGLLAARAVKIKPKEEASLGNMVVFASSSGEERSLPYDEKQHGLFTYFLLSKLKDTKGNANYEEISEYLKKEVSKTSLLKKSLQQTPHTKISSRVKDKWKSWSFR